MRFRRGDCSVRHFIGGAVFFHDGTTEEVPASLAGDATVALLLQAATTRALESPIIPPYASTRRRMSELPLTSKRDGLGAIADTAGCGWSLRTSVCR